MAIVNSDFLGGLYKSWRALFLETFETTETDYEKIVTVIPSDTLQEVYNWLGAVPKMREWVDERIPAGLFSHNYTIVNKDWEASIEVDRNELEDNKLQLVTARIKDLGIEAKRHPDELVFNLLQNGFSNKCYDGKTFFANDHKEGKSGIQSNIVIGALSLNTLKEAVSKIMSFKNDQGKPMRIVPDVLVVGTGEVQWIAREILNSTYITIAGVTDREKPTTNVLQRIVPTLIITPYVEENAWFLLCCNRAIRPLIFQLRKKPEFVALDNPNTTETVFMRKKFLYGVDARYNAGYGLWQFAVAGQV